MCIALTTSSVLLELWSRGCNRRLQHFGNPERFNCSAMYWKPCHRHLLYFPFPYFLLPLLLQLLLLFFSFAHHLTLTLTAPPR